MMQRDRYGMPIDRITSLRDLRDHQSGAANLEDSSDFYTNSNYPYDETGFNAPGMRGSDPSMDYNSLMLNPPPYSRGIAGNITSTEDIAPHDYDALVRQRQAQNLIDNPDMDEWDMDPRLAARQRASDRREASRQRAADRRGASRQRATDRRGASMDRLSERQALSEQRRVQRQVEMEDTRNRASSRRELAQMAASENRAAARIRALSRMPSLGNMNPSQLTPKEIEQVSAAPQAFRDRWRDNKGLFQGGREGRLFGRARDWVEDRF